MRALQRACLAGLWDFTAALSIFSQSSDFVLSRFWIDLGLHPLAERLEPCDRGVVWGVAGIDDAG